MKGNHCLVTFVLLLSMVGALALTSSNYVDCKDIYPDEFLDLALAWQYPILPVFAPHLNTHPFLLRVTKMFNFRRFNLLIISLRC